MRNVWALETQPLIETPTIALPGKFGLERAFPSSIFLPQSEALSCWPVITVLLLPAPSSAQKRDAGSWKAHPRQLRALCASPPWLTRTRRFGPACSLQYRVAVYQVHNMYVVGYCEGLVAARSGGYLSDRRR